MTYSLENCQFLNTVYTCLDTYASVSITPPNDQSLITVKNCYFSAYLKSDTQSLGYSIRNTTGSLLLENNTFEGLYRAVRMGTSGGADFVGREDVKNVKIKWRHPPVNWKRFTFRTGRL